MKLFESLRQAPLFVVFFCLGVMLAIIYDIFYLFRYKRKPALTAISDIIFSMAFFVLTVYFIQTFNSGALKIFMFFAMFCGFTVARLTLGTFIKIFIDFFVKILYNLYRRLNMGKFFKALLK